MTAQVAVLNTRGVAIASDSAVTVSDGSQSRSYTSADKIFPLRDVPVAVLHSGNASIFGVPWQLVVNMWSQARGSTQAVSMSAYAQEFADWIAQQSTLVPPEEQDAFFRWTFRDFLLAIRRSIQRGLSERGLEISAGYIDGEAAAIVDVEVDGYHGRLLQLPPFEGMDAVDAAAMCERLKEPLREDLDWVFDDTPRTAHLDATAWEIAQLLVARAEPFSTDAVLAFVGYGRDDYFPSLHQLTVSGVVAGVVRTYDHSESQVTSASRVSITPLGLTEAIRAFLGGAYQEYRDAAHYVLSQCVGDAEPAEGGESPHDLLNREFDDLSRREFVKPMLDIVEALPMVEMLRLADSLVGLATLRQLIQGQTSVGGPIDLARITKSEGFEWVRSKDSEEVEAFAR